VGFLNNALYTLFHVEGRPGSMTLDGLERSSSLTSEIYAVWTLILLAGRMAIPLEIRDTAKVDGATGLRGFVHITFRCSPTST